METALFEKSVARTALTYPDFKITPEQVMIAWNAVGLAGEAGEVSDLIKKGIFHQQEIDLLKIKKELGDVMWYIAALCKCLNLTLEEVMQANIEKLVARFPNGYSPERTLIKTGAEE